jgi:hypothetical protein
MKLIQEFMQTFRTPSADELALRELEEAQRELLKAQSGREYADSLVAYHTARIRRLSGRVGAST